SISSGVPMVTRRCLRSEAGHRRAARAQSAGGAALPGHAQTSARDHRHARGDGAVHGGICRCGEELMRTRAAILTFVLAGAAAAAQRAIDKPTPTPQGPTTRCCAPKVVDANGKELGPLERWDDRTPSWPHQAWVRYTLAGGDDVVLNVSADAILAGTGLGGSAVVFTSNDCSGNAFVTQMTMAPLTMRDAIAGSS